MAVRRFVLVALSAAFAFAALPAGHSSAADVEDMAISRSEPYVSRDYGPMVGDNPNTVTHKPSDCRTATYCDVIDLKIDTRGFASDDLFEVEITLSWENSADVPEVGTVNDVDLFVYDPKEIRIAQDSSVSQPAFTSIDTPPAGTYYIVANNATGVNTGYTVEVEVIPLGKQKAIPKFERPESQGGGPMFTPLPPLPTGNAAPPDEENLEPGETLAPVLRPGEDGSPTSVALEGVQAGAQADKGGLTWWGYLIMSAAIAGVGGGTGFIILRRIRARGV